MDTPNITPALQAPIPKKGGIGKAIKWLIILGIIAGIAFAIYTFFFGGETLSGRYYPMGDTSMGQFYEFRGRDATLYAMPGMPGMTYSYRIRGDRLILSAAGQSVEFVISDCRTEFGTVGGGFMGIDIGGFTYKKVP
jgi:hypothetical protein